jgi:ADP-heptose:LPS heptosyltransferase/predicted negative regulator of RcsB-dependent stress response
LSYIRGYLRHRGPIENKTLESREQDYGKTLFKALDSLVSKYAGNIETIFALHDSAEFFYNHNNYEQSLMLLRTQKDLAAGKFSVWEQRASLRMASIELLLGEYEEAMEILEHYTDRPYLFSDKSLYAEMLERYAEAYLHRGDAQTFMRLQWKLAGRIGTAARASKLIIASRGMVKLLATPASEANWRAKLYIFPLCCASILGKTPVAGDFFRKFIEWGYRAAGFYFDRIGGNKVEMLSEGSDNGAENKGDLPILVTRGMGGIGDILMMTAGLVKLKEKTPDREIVFAVPKGFKSLLSGLPGIRVVDIEKEVFHRDRYSVLYDLTTCPAGRIESLTAPDVKLSRIEIFGKAMGVRERDVRKWKPFYRVTPEEKAAAESFVAQAANGTRKRIGIQVYSAERYKDYPHLDHLVQLLAGEHEVFLFHHRPLKGFDIQHVHKIDDKPLREAIAIFSLCDVAVTPDSGFTHIAGALGIPTVSIFGPTCGKQFTKHYPTVDYIDARATVHCVPCWRNEYSECKLSGTRESQCMKAVRAEDVFEMVDAKLSQGE